MTDESHSSSHAGQAPKKSHLFLFLVLIAIMLVAIGGITLLQRRSQFKALANDTQTQSIPTVAVTHPTVEESQEDLVLPGTMQAYVETPIYARTNGYLKKWYYDIGAKVPKGALLAEIDTPEIDQQLSSAKADLNTAKANTDLSQTTAARYDGLLKTDSVSKQEVDNANGDLAAKRATQNSSEANVRRLEDLKSFEIPSASMSMFRSFMRPVFIPGWAPISNLINILGAASRARSSVPPMPSIRPAARS